MKYQLTEIKADLNKIEIELIIQKSNFHEIQISLQEYQSDNNSLIFQFNQTRIEN